MKRAWQYLAHKQMKKSVVVLIILISSFLNKTEAQNSVKTQKRRLNVYS